MKGPFMSVFLDLRNGRSAHDLSQTTPGSTGPVLGPFLSVRLYRDEVRVATTIREFGLQRVGDWIFYGGALYSELSWVS
jgi:hypothetical protein